MTGFNNTLKKLELSLRNGQMHESLMYLSKLTEDASTEDEQAVVDELGDIIVEGDDDRLESFFDDAYEEAR